MNLPEEYSKLASRLIQLSNDDSVKWEKAKHDDGFILDHKKVQIEIFPFTNDDEEKQYYYFSFLKDDIRDSFNVSNWDFGYDTLVELYNSASRNAQGVRDAIDDFLSDFD